MAKHTNAGQKPADRLNTKPRDARTETMPCPWCGVTETLEVYSMHTGRFDTNKDEVMLHFVGCERCGAEGPSIQLETEDAAWQAWDAMAKGAERLAELRALFSAKLERSSARLKRFVKLEAFANAAKEQTMSQMLQLVLDEIDAMQEGKEAVEAREPTALLPCLWCGRQECKVVNIEEAGLGRCRMPAEASN